MPNDLEKHTQMYWHVSLVWRGRLNHKFTVADALRAFRNIIDNAGPHRALRRKALQLNNEVITGQETKKKAKSNA